VNPYRLPPRQAIFRASFNSLKDSIETSVLDGPESPKKSIAGPPKSEPPDNAWPVISRLRWDWRALARQGHDSLMGCAATFIWGEVQSYGVQYRDKFLLKKGLRIFAFCNNP